MKISHGKLEGIRRDPARLTAGPTTEFYSFGRARALQLAVYRLHDDGLDAAIAYLEALYRRNFKRPEALGPLVTRLRSYDVAFKSLGNIVLQRNARMRYELVGDDQLTGEIPRIDIVPSSGGAALWLFGQTRFDWTSELRMPLLQQWLETRLGAGTGDVSVGYYFFDIGAHESRCYADSELADANVEVGRLLART